MRDSCLHSLGSAIMVIVMQQLMIRRIGVEENIGSFKTCSMHEFMELVM